MTAAIKIGLLAPLSGMVELYGPEISMAAKIAVDQINQAGGLLGRTLELVIEDDGSLPETALPAAKRLVEQHGCHAMIGNLLSNSRIAVANHVAEPFKVPYLNFSFYEGSIFSRYFFHFAALPNQQIDKMIPYMAKNYGPKFFFAGNNYEWPMGSIDAAKHCLLSIRGEVVGEEYFPIGTTDFQALLEHVAKSGADVFVPYAAGIDQVSLLTQFTEAGLKDRMAVVMGHYDEAMVGKLPTDVRRGFYSSNTYFMDIDSEQNEQYLQALSQQSSITGIWPSGNGVLTNFGEGTFNCVKAFAQAVINAGSLDKEKIVDALENVVINGPQGRLIMDPLTHHATVNNYLARCDDHGRFHIIEKFLEIPPTIPPRYQNSLQDYIESNAYSSEFDHWQSIATVLINHTEQGFDIDQVNISSYWSDLYSKQEIKSHFLKHKRELNYLYQHPHSLLLTNPLNTETKTYMRVTPMMSENNRMELLVECSRKVSYENNSSRSITSHISKPVLVSNNGVLVEAANSTSELIIALAGIAIIATDNEGHIIRANNMACKLFGYEQTEIMGMSIHLLLPPNKREQHKKHLRHFTESRVQSKQMGVRGEISGYRKDGTFFPAMSSICKFHGHDGSTLVVTLQDITDAKKAEEELVWQATHDSLTKLPNRILIEDRLENALNRSLRNDNKVAVLFIDLDRFKLVNDNYGHEMGDELLIQLAHRLLASVRPGDTVARFGGDEFIILCDQIEDKSVAETIAERVLQSFKEPIFLEGNGFYATVSIGISVGSGKTHTTEHLLQNADAAMYAVKEQGRDGWKHFSSSIGNSNHNQLAITNGLREAIANNELSIVLQPIINLCSNKLVGAETLLRWTSASGSISPAVFIPIAETSGIIHDIGNWVFDQACQLLKNWQSKLGEQLPYLSVNLSQRQFLAPNFMIDIKNIVEKNGISPQQLLLEITETTLVDDVNHSLAILSELGELGFKFAVDDFGTGYSSLSQLKAFPVNTLKIDKTFIDDINCNENTRSITSAIISMAQALGLNVIAEGVETQSQLDVLKALHCSNVQGYYYYRPMTISDFEQKFLKTMKNSQKKKAG
ncbi:MAG: EAL domain-containing protein [Gammaproteobacteria bacterium]|nr:EAL domain-containing protein [Gammaproteobacteria bacterium]